MSIATRSLEFGSRLAALLGISLVLSFLAPGSALRAADAPIVIKFSHVAAPQAHKSRAAEHFKQLAESYTNGRVKVELYPNSQLYKDKEELEALQLGAVQMLAPSVSKFGPLGIKAFEVFDLPYIFAGYEELSAVTQGPVGRELLDKLESKGLIGLAYWNNGFKILSANSKLLGPDDVLGLKMRIQASKVIEAQMWALGALPQVTAFSEAYQALSSGVVDGTENTPANMYNQKMFEVQKHATLTNHGYLGYAVISNAAFWKGLPPDIRAALERAIAETTPVANALAHEENEQALEQMRKSGRTTFHEPTPAELAAWRAALLPVHDEMAGRVGRDLIDRIYAATGHTARQPAMR
ncbi:MULTISPECIES: TRAP transporter substrate-binding protein [Hyphomicrobium]|jgi:C4-dicarboxylate-binding protein DctP|uniref:TRAP transporter substrate-binding protein n=1 Tax=Hyphomicrobium TaxID=81 RepID=UPI000369206F|nr:MULTISPECIES: TRAP transporter substrate-binding protein [Hyphomicrobium]WBT37518.1 TRAP transporter substrate-binding protein [Hyphomicrobium sp. DMF-1]HML42633.1 TRAP transporter substrate-binding protein [Hyphomicrobium zavarzinii]